MSDLIKANDYVYIRGGETQLLIKIRTGYRHKLGRLGQVNMFNLIGQPFDRTYMIDDKTKNFIVVSDDMIPDLEAEMGATETEDSAANNDTNNNTNNNDDTNNNNQNDNNDSETKSTSTNPKQRDNRNLLDINSSQSLDSKTLSEIKEKEGVTGIVNKLVQNSATFHTKTAFAQEKYIKKKKAQYNSIFRVLRPSVKELSELWNPAMVRRYTMAPDKAKWIRLRSDSIAQILSLGNVNHDSRVMIYERTNSFACAAILERMSSAGRLFNVVQPKITANLQMAEQMGLDSSNNGNSNNTVALKEQWKVIKFENAIFATVNQKDTLKRTIKERTPRDEIPPEELANPSSDRIRMELELNEVQEIMKPENPNLKMDSLIVIDDEDPAAITSALLPYLKTSGSICVFSPFITQLTPLQQEVRDCAVNIRIQETWLREIQVLPNRTHPQVNMSHNGGYIFSAVKVQPLQDIRSIPTSEAKKQLYAERQQQKESGVRRERDE